ncbi:hypothetical protein D0T87_16255 [Bacteroides sp. 51]|nr:hypothetical protein [Bacteroides sp. 51]
MNWIASPTVTNDNIHPLPPPAGDTMLQVSPAGGGRGWILSLQIVLYFNIVATRNDVPGSEFLHSLAGDKHLAFLLFYAKLKKQRKVPFISSKPFIHGQSKNGTSLFFC